MGESRDEQNAAPVYEPFRRMSLAKERIERIREQSWHPNGWGAAIGGGDVRWLCACLLRVLAVMQDGKTTYATIDAEADPPKILTPMMVERDALAEALRDA